MARLVIRYGVGFVTSEGAFNSAWLDLMQHSPSSVSQVFGGFPKNERFHFERLVVGGITPRWELSLGVHKDLASSMQLAV